MDERPLVGDSNHHVTANPYLDVHSFPTIIGGRSNRLQAESIAQQNLVIGFGHIGSFGAMFDLQKIVTDTARHMLFEFSQRSRGFECDTKGKCPKIALETFALSVCYCAMEKHCCGKTIRGITVLSGVEEEELRNCLRRLRKVIPDLLESHSSEENPKIQGFVRSIVQQLELSMRVEVSAVEIAQQAMDDLYEELAGKRPSTIAAVCVFLAAQQLGIEVEAENIAACAAISRARMVTVAALMGKRKSPE